MRVLCPNIGDQQPIKVYKKIYIPFRNTKRNEYVVTGYYVREYVQGFLKAKKRATYIALKTKRWGKVESVRVFNKRVKKVQRFISVYTDNGLDCDDVII